MSQDQERNQDKLIDQAFFPNDELKITLFHFLRHHFSHLQDVLM